MKNNVQFFTATILEWKHLLKEDRYKDIIADSMRFLVNENRVQIYCFVIMPNHLHLIWKINEDLEREDVQRDFLKFTAMKIKSDLMINNPKLLSEFYVGAKDRDYQFWERNPLSVNILQMYFMDQKMNYIHNNPVMEKWRLSETPEGYKYSSASFYILNDKKWDFLTSYMDIKLD